MKKPRLVLTDAAIADVLDQADWYLRQAGRALAQRWEKAVTSALSQVLRRPDVGSPCTFRAPELRGVRRKAIPRFPKHLLFYRFDGEEVLVLSVVHGARDLESLL
jgi:toxin ParE1/3/4